MGGIDDSFVRNAAFGWLADQVAIHGDVLPRHLIERGLTLRGVRVPLVGPQGIFKPKVMTSPISITTAPSGPYDDLLGDDGLLRYRYRGTDPAHYQNRSLRYVMEQRLPLVYFHGVAKGRYMATWPVYVIADDPARLTVTVDVEAAESAHLFGSAWSELAAAEADPVLRRYAAAQVRVRMHQRSFRERVLEAYRRKCAFCSLRHEELLDAAHIIPDADLLGEPVVANGLSLCTLHHSAFDRQVIGLRPDYVIEVRPDVLAEKDGPTLTHAIQALHHQPIVLPHSLAQRPSPERLQVRYSQFLEAS